VKLSLMLQKSVRASMMNFCSLKHASAGNGPKFDACSTRLRAQRRARRSGFERWKRERRLELAQQRRHRNLPLAAPVVTDRLRVRVLRTTLGFNLDPTAAKGTMKIWGNVPDARPTLREIEVYAPTGPQRLTLTSQAAPLSAGQVQPASLSAPVADTISVALQNSANKPFSGRLQVQAPAGWTVAAPTAPLSILARGRAQRALHVSPPANVVAGRNVVTVSLVDAKGALADAAPAIYNFASAVSLAPQSPGSVRGGAQLLTAQLKNTSSAPQSGTVRLEVSGAENVAPLELPFGPLAPGETKNLEFSLPGLQLANHQVQARYTLSSNGLVQPVMQNLALRSYLAVGPFAQQLDVPAAPEQNLSVVDLNQTFTDQFGQSPKWKTISSDADGGVNLRGQFGQNDNASAFVATWVNSPKAQNALLSWGADDGGCVWLGGTKVVDDNGAHGAAPGQKIVPVQLKAGRNLVRMRVTQGGGDWKFYFDLLDPTTHQPMSGLTYSTQP